MTPAGAPATFPHADLGTNPTTPVLVVIDGQLSPDSPLPLALVSEGFRVLVAPTGAEGLSLCAQIHPAAVVVSTVLPDLSGHTVLRLLRQVTGVPVLGLSASDSEDEAVLAFELGAVDCLSRPARLKESAARIKAALGRPLGRDLGETHHPPRPAQPVLRAGPVEIHLGKREVMVRGSWVHTRPKELELLILLVSESGRAVSRQRVLAELWPDHPADEEKSLDQHVRRLRSLVEKDRARPRHIVTVRGYGHRFEP